MNRFKKILINIAVILLLSFVFVSSNNLSITPISAFESFEKKHHYGPSQIKHQISYNGKNYFLAKYDKWFSMTIIDRNLLLFWSNSSASIGNEINKNEAVNIQLGATQKNEEIVYQYFGVVNDSNISRIEIKQKSGDIIEINEFYDNMFIYVNSFKTKGQSSKYFEYLDYKLSAYDKNNNVVYEFEFNQY